MEPVLAMVDGAELIAQSKFVQMIALVVESVFEDDAFVT